MSANLRNGRFSEISDPEVECFAPLLQRLFFTEADLNDTLLSREDGFKLNELVDLSHGTRCHPKSAETSFNEIFAN